MKKHIFPKLFSAICILAMTATAFSGCANNTTPTVSTPSGSSKETVPESGTSKEEPKEIVDLTWYVEVPDSFPDEQKVFDELNKYTEEKIGVHVNQIFWKWADYSEKVPVIVNSGQKYDICFTADWGNLFLPNVDRGAYADITDLIPQYAKETQEMIPEMVWNAATVKGKIYAIPDYKEVGAQPGIMVNTDIAKECGVDYSSIKTLGDWENVLKLVKEKRPDTIGFTGSAFNMLQPIQLLSGDDNVPAVIRVPGMGDAFADQGDKVFNQYATKEFENYCTMMYRWMQAGYLPEDPVTYDTDASGRDRDDQAGKLFSWLISYAPGYKDTRAATMGHGVEFIPLRDSLYAGNGGGMMAVSITSENKEKSLEFLNLVNTDNYVGTLIRHGIKDVHYKEVETKDAAGNTYIQCDPFATGFTKENHPYNYDYGWQFGSVFNQNWVVSYAPDIASQFEAYNASAKVVPFPGFTLDIADISTEQAAITNVSQQYLTALSKGATDPATGIPAFKTALEDAGMQKYLDEAQKQLDAFK